MNKNALLDLPHQQTQERKKDHINIVLQKEVTPLSTNGLEKVQFIHHALPEMDKNEILLVTSLFNRQFSLPLLISSMTGGTDSAKKINENLALAAEKYNIPMGLGSMRILLEDPSLLPSFCMKKIAPHLFLLANIGAVQFNYGLTPKQCQWLVEQVQADALILHLNPLQEILQPEGNHNWKNILEKIEQLVCTLSVPIIIKEVGFGLSKKVASALYNRGITAFDVAGKGGTSWSRVEMFRAKTPIQSAVAGAFDDWGISTHDALVSLRRNLPDAVVIASGGIRNGVDGAKTLALGASLFGIAKPFLSAAHSSFEKVCEQIEIIREQLTAVMFCTQSSHISHLQSNLVDS